MACCRDTCGRCVQIGRGKVLVGQKNTDPTIATEIGLPRRDRSALGEWSATTKSGRTQSNIVFHAENEADIRDSSEKQALPRTCAYPVACLNRGASLGGIN